MALDTAVKGAIIGSVVGPNHSPLMPAAFYGAWLDGSDVVLAMTGATVPHAAFEIVGATATNTAVVDGGVCPATVPTKFALMDTATGDTIMLPPVTVTFSETPAEGDPLSFAPGELVFEYTEV